MEQVDIILNLIRKYPEDMQFAASVQGGLPMFGQMVVSTNSIDYNPRSCYLSTYI